MHFFQFKKYFSGLTNKKKTRLSLWYLQAFVDKTKEAGQTGAVNVLSERLHISILTENV